MSQFRKERRKIDITVPQLTKDTVADGGKIIPFVSPRTGSDVGMAVFEMDVPDPIGVSGKRFKWIAATESVVSCIEAQPDEVWIGTLHQCVNFCCCLYISGTVVMENGA